MRQKKNMHNFTSVRTSIFRGLFSFTASCSLVFAFPVSTNYQLKDYGIGSGGVSNASSTNYAATAISGEVDNGKLSSTNFNLGTGLLFTNQANVPLAPTFTNPSNYYNTLKIVLDTSSNASDTKFAIAISSDGFATTQYVQNDATVGSVLGIEDYQTYTAWGGATGTMILGLTANTNYTVKVKSMQGKFTETAFGPTATAATVASQLTFDIDVSATDTESASPYTISMGSLTANSIIDSSEKIWVDFVSNAGLGGNVYISSSNSGLKSLGSGHTISSATGNLGSLTEGMGIQGSTATNGLTLATLYNVSGQSIGTVSPVVREIFTATSPTTNGRGSFIVKAKASSITPAANDYQEILQMTASASF